MASLTTKRSLFEDEEDVLLKEARMDPDSGRVDPEDVVVVLPRFPIPMRLVSVNGKKSKDPAREVFLCVPMPTELARQLSVPDVIIGQMITLEAAVKLLTKRLTSQSSTQDEHTLRLWGEFIQEHERAMNHLDFQGFLRFPTPTCVMSEAEIRKAFKFSGIEHLPAIPTGHRSTFYADILESVQWYNVSKGDKMWEHVKARLKDMWDVQHTDDKIRECIRQRGFQKAGLQTIEVFRVASVVKFEELTGLTTLWDCEVDLYNNPYYLETTTRSLFLQAVMYGIEEMDNEGHEGIDEKRTYNKVLAKAIEAQAMALAVENSQEEEDAVNEVTDHLEKIAKKLKTDLAHP